jgi:nucleoside-diphosphate-sugar epimerase
MAFSFVDARDVAETHVRAAEVEEAGGTRCIISAGTVYAQDLRAFTHIFSIMYGPLTFLYIAVDVANSMEPKPWDGLPKGNPGATKDKGHLGTIQLDQFARVYGFKLHTPAETIRDSLNDFKARGWIR